jgi:hypothetical protein
MMSELLVLCGLLKPGQEPQKQLGAPCSLQNTAEARSDVMVSVTLDMFNYYPYSAEDLFECRVVVSPMVSPSSDAMGCLK